MIIPKKAVELQVGDVIPAGVAAGSLTVDAVLNIDGDDHLMVDVETGPNANIWDVDALAAAVEAVAAQWLSNAPRRLYRLYFHRTATVLTGVAE